MTSSGNKHPGGRPKGLIRRTHITHGARVKPENLGDVLTYWKKHNPGMAKRTEELISRFLRQLGWTAGHPRYREVRDLSIRIVSRGALLVKIISDDFERPVKDPSTGAVITHRCSDELAILGKLDSEIDNRYRMLKILVRSRRVRTQKGVIDD